MAGYTPGTRQSVRVNRWEVDGDCRQMRSGGDWPNSTAESARIPKIVAKALIRRSHPEDKQGLTLCSVVADRVMVSTLDCRLMDSTGQPPRWMEQLPCIT